MDERKRAKASNEVEIDLFEIFGLLLHWLWLIVLVALLVGIVTFCCSRFVLPEEFQSSTKVYILSRTESGSDMPTSQDMQVSTQLTKDYAELITSRYVLEKVISDLQLPVKYEELKSCINVTTPSDSRIIQITATDHDPWQAQNIARAVRDTAAMHIQNVMDIDAINIVDDANLPDHKSAPHNARNAVIGALIGAFLVMAVLIVRNILDDTIKSNDDIEEYLGLSCLALIPLDESITGKQTKNQIKRPRLKPHMTKSGNH